MDKIMKNVCGNESGFALIIAMMMLLIMTLLGIAATRNTVIELGIAGNERIQAQRFYTAYSGWKQAGPFLNNMATPPSSTNQTRRPADTSINWSDKYYQIVRNYGNGVDGVVNETFSANTEDGKILNVPYWYRIFYQNDGKAQKFDNNYREFQYGTNCSAAGTVEVATRITRVFKVGY